MAVTEQVPHIDYGKRIRELRRQVGWSQTRLAKEAGIHNVTLSKLETGRVKMPELGTLMSIAAAFNLPLETMLREKPIVLGIRIEKEE